jgi:hypothetical protein
MASARKTTVVRIECPPGVSRADFLASLQSWLNHQCVLTNLKNVVSANIEGAFDAEFDNPRDARSFARRFATRPISHRQHPAMSNWHLIERAFFSAISALSRSPTIAATTAPR